MARYSTKFLHAKLSRFAVDFGLSVSRGWTDGKCNVGGLYLDYAKEYGGWQLCQHTNEFGACRVLTGTKRLSAAELVAWFEGAEWAADAIDTGKAHSRKFRPR